MVWKTELSVENLYQLENSEPIYVTNLFVYPLKTENPSFIDVFKVYRKRPVAWNVWIRVWWNRFLSMLLLTEGLREKEAIHQRYSSKHSWKMFIVVSFEEKLQGVGLTNKWTPPQVLFFNFVKFYRRPNVKNPSDKRDRSIWHLYPLSPTASVFTNYLFVVWLSSILNSCWDHSSFL